MSTAAVRSQLLNHTTCTLSAYSSDTESLEPAVPAEEAEIAEEASCLIDESSGAAPDDPRRILVRIPELEPAIQPKPTTAPSESRHSSSGHDQTEFKPKFDQPAWRVTQISPKWTLGILVAAVVVSCLILFRNNTNNPDPNHPAPNNVDSTAANPADTPERSTLADGAHQAGLSESDIADDSLSHKRVITTDGSHDAKRADRQPLGIDSDDNSPSYDSYAERLLPKISGLPAGETKATTHPAKRPEQYDGLRAEGSRLRNEYPSTGRHWSTAGENHRSRSYSKDDGPDLSVMPVDAGRIGSSSMPRVQHNRFVDSEVDRKIENSADRSPYESGRRSARRVEGDRTSDLRGRASGARFGGNIEIPTRSSRNY